MSEENEVSLFSDAVHGATRLLRCWCWCRSTDLHQSLLDLLAGENRWSTATSAVLCSEVPASSAGQQWCPYTLRLAPWHRHLMPTPHHFTSCCISSMLMIVAADRNLPNKTIRLMRYAATHPAGYTHVLKTDDDCYVRLPQLLKALDLPTPPSAGATDGAAAAGEGGKGAAADQPAAGAAAAAKPAAGPGRRVALATSAPKAKQVNRKVAQHSDGLSTYSLRDLTRKLGTWRWVDDNTGTAHTLGQLFNASRRSYAVVGSAVAGVLSQHAAELAARAAAQPRMAGVYLGCVENKNGFWPIRDSNSKW